MQKASFHIGQHLRKSGFTLLELLVGLAIVSLLAALLLTGVKNMRQKAEGAQCIQKLRALSQGTLLYAADHDQTLPSLETGGAGLYDGIWFRYRDLVSDYLDLAEPDKAKLFTCTSDKEFSKIKLPSYVFSGGNQYKPGLLKGVAGARLHSLSAPGRTVLLMEGSTLFFKSFHAGENPNRKDFRTYMSFADGHAGIVLAWCAPGTLNAGINPPDSYGYIFGD